jgi:hypothetical protein
MIFYHNLNNKLKNNRKIKILFVTPNYGEIYSYSKIHIDYFDKNKFICDVIYITNDDINNVINMFFEKKYDCIFNLCDGYINNKNNIPETNFIRELEKNNIPYIGASEYAYKISKFDLSQLENSPKIYNLSDIENNNLKYPLFIKPNNLGCSELIDENSIIYNREQLFLQLNKILIKTNDIVIQEYIDGNEYTAIVFRNKSGKIICLDPIEIIFTKLKTKYLTNDIKINKFDDIIYNFNIEDKELIKNICVTTYEKLKLNSYVRIDLRDKYVIDINAYPEILGLPEEENPADSIIQKFYNFDQFLIDNLYEAVHYRISNITHQTKNKKNNDGKNSQLL